MPSYVQEAETTWATSLSPKTTLSFSALAGDVLVAVSMIAVNGVVTISNNGAALDWTEQQSISVANEATIYLWTTILDVDRAGLTVTFTHVDDGWFWGGTCLTFRNSLIGASDQRVQASGAPSLDITTTRDNSILVVAVSDNSALDGGVRTWRTGAGALTEKTYYHDFGGLITVYLGFHANAGAIGTKTVGLTSPSMSPSTVAIELTDDAIPPTPEQTDIITNLHAR